MLNQAGLEFFKSQQPLFILFRSIMYNLNYNLEVIYSTNEALNAIHQIIFELLVLSIV